MVPPLITLEEHFLSDKADDVKDLYSEQFRNIPGLADKLADVGPLRLKSMDETNIAIQVVSHGPGAMRVSQCQAANDQLAAAVRANPDRFAGFAVLPMADPDAAAKELTRCVKDAGFVGALVDNRSGNEYYDGLKYDSFWRAAQDLDVPIYLHPTWPTPEQTDLLYTGNFSRAATLSLGASGWGWHSDVGLHILRLFAAGTFDRFPRLKIIAGHMGEVLPFMLQRIALLSPRWGARERPFREVYDANIWITTSGVWSIDPMATILRNTKIERILYSVDYPFAKNEDGLTFMQDLERSGWVTPEQLERIAYRNSEDLFGLKVTTKKVGK
ncbi:2-3-dihydroxybenzoate decarboxylase [Apiospora arundinis]